jgi:biotin synthase
MFSRDELKSMLFARGHEQIELFRKASSLRDELLGQKCFIRAVVEITNLCRVNCEYCEMRRDNRSLDRYTMEPHELMTIAKQVASENIPTIFIQGGEAPQTTDIVIAALPEIKNIGLSVILCLGNKTKDEYLRLREAGADGYILKVETSDAELHRRLRYSNLSERLACVEALLGMGYHVGTGLICGLPGQTIDSIVDDLYYLGEYPFSMCSVSPFIPSTNTPLASAHPGDIALTLNIISILRLLHPTGMIPSVSALEKLEKDGQVRGLRAGANVVTVNFSPSQYRELYRIYTKDRFIVELDHTCSVARRADLDISDKPSLGPVIVPSKYLRTFFNEKWSSSVPTRESVYTWANPLLERALDSKEFPCQGTAYDLGCGDGRHSIPLASRGLQVIGVDFSSMAIKRLMHRVQLCGVNSRVRGLCEDMRKINQVGTCSVVIISSVLHYFSMEEVKKIITNVSRNLAPGGILYIGLETDIFMEYEPGRFFTFAPQYNHPPEEIRNLVEQAGGWKSINQLHTPCSGQVTLPPTLRGILHTASTKYHRRFILTEFLAVKSQ